MPTKNSSHGENERLAQLRKLVQAESSDGLKLLSSPEDNPICSIAVDASIPGIVVTWKDYATSTQLRFVHEHILHMLKTHGLSKILGDDTALQTIHGEDQAWIIQDWMPRAIRAGLRAAASKSPTAYFAKLAVTSVQAAAPEALALSVFSDTAEARKWLEACN